MNQTRRTLDLLSEGPIELTVRHIRRVEEGPEPVPGQTYVQFRVFDVFDLGDSPCAREFQSRLFSACRESPDLVAVTSRDIMVGRAGRNSLIGNHAAYLFAPKRYRPEVPIFLDPGSRGDS